MHDREPGRVMGWAVMGAGCAAGTGRGDADDYLPFPSRLPSVRFPHNYRVLFAHIGAGVLFPHTCFPGLYISGAGQPLAGAGAIGE